MITDFNAWRSNCFGNKMHSPKRIKITDVNPRLICVLCGGYYIDATTVIECLHSFCKSCIVKYLEKNKYCPICDVLIHKTTPLLNIRPDNTLQNVVYKLVPSLFKNEMQRRVEFYQKHQDSLPPTPEQRGEITDNTSIFFPDELLIICLEHQGFQASHPVNQRYLHCPAALPVSHLIKLIKGKYNLSAKHQVHMYFKDDLLMEHITLMDVAYTYQCRRKVPIQLSFKILELKTKRIRIINREPVKDEPKKEKIEEKEWKEVQLQISENGVMSVRNVESCECSPIPAVEAPPVYSPSMSSSSANLMINNSLQTTPPDPAPTRTSEAIEQSSIKVATPDINVDPPTVSSVSPSLSSSGTIEKPPAPVDSPVSSPLPTPSPISSTASSLTSPETTVTSPWTSVTSSLVTFPSRMTPPVITSTASQTYSLTASTINSNSITSPIPSATFSSSTTSVTVASPISSVNFTSPIPLNPTSTTFTSDASKSIFTTSVSVISSPLVNQSITITTQHPTTSVATHPISSVALHSVPSATSSVNTFPTLPGSPSISLPHLLIGGNVHPSSPGMESCIVTTMAGMKPSTHLVPSSFPIMSSCRPQNEPIVSVSKVSKDQVRKPNNVIEVNKLSISRVPPGGMKEKGENLNKIVNKLSPNERVIGNTSVTIRPVTNNPNPPPKMYPIPRPMHPSPPTSMAKEKQQVRYKTLKSPTKQWNPSIDRATQMQLMKQNADQSKPPRFFKMRNMPRFLGNPASGVKPLYACPEEPVANQPKQKLTLMKVDPKTIPTSSIPRSPTKQPPPYTPGSPKMNKPPPAYPDPKPPSYLNPRLPSPAHAGSFLPPNPYHLLYSGYSSFSPETNPMLSPELIRSMCAYHPSLPPAIGMLFNPGMHPAMPRPQENYKPEPTPAVQRIPPSKTDTPPPKPPDDKRFPSPLGMSESKKLTPTPPPISPKEVEKPQPPVTQESKVKSPVPVVEPSPQVLNTEVKENHNEVTSKKLNMEESNVVKVNCDDININNNISKESPPSQPSECLATRPQ